ncbi:MAG: signal recognition particle-docking protein FtsY, partial [Campylobacteraceae bacterium 4484_166]
QGNSAVAQAKEFKDIIGIDGVIVTKLDGTAMGGSLFAISNELRLPIYYIGTGEKIDDIEIFVVEDFIDQLMEFIYEK